MEKLKFETEEYISIDERFNKIIIDGRFDIDEIIRLGEYLKQQQWKYIGDWIQEDGSIESGNYPLEVRWSPGKEHLRIDATISTDELLELAEYIKSVQQQERIIILLI